MSQQSLKGAAFSFLWGVIGVFIALQMYPYFWWVGMFAGVFGYLTWEFGEVVRAVPRAWRRATSWKPNKEYWKSLGCCFIYSFVVTGSFSALAGLSFFAIFAVLLGGLLTASSIIVATSTLFSVSFLLALMTTLDFDPKTDFQMLENGRQLASEFNLLTICFKHIPRGAYLLVTHSIIFIPFVVKVLRQRILIATSTIGHFIYHLFRLIHSEERLLVGVYIASGVAVGYLVFRNAIAGGLAAGGLAYAAREIISKRILKVTPLRNGN